MTNLPSGTVTFLFTDIEGSTKLAQDLSLHEKLLMVDCAQQSKFFAKF